MYNDEHNSDITNVYHLIDGVSSDVVELTSKSEKNKKKTLTKPKK